MNKAQFHVYNAIMIEWRKCLQIELLILWELAGWNVEGLKEFEQRFWEYLFNLMNNAEELDELVKQFEQVTDLHLGEVKLKGGRISKDIKSIQALCIQIGAVILFSVGEWERKDIRKFVYTCWDYIKGWAVVYQRIKPMEKETGLDLSFKTKHRHRIKKGI